MAREGRPAPGIPTRPGPWDKDPDGWRPAAEAGRAGRSAPGALRRPCGSSTPGPALPVPTGLSPAWGGQTGARLDLTWEAEDRMVPSFSTESDHRPRPWRCCRQGEGHVPSQLTGSSPCRIRVSPLNAKHRTPPAAPTCTPPAPYCKLIPSRGPKHKQNHFLQKIQMITGTETLPPYVPIMPVPLHTPPPINTLGSSRAAPDFSLCPQNK